MIRATGAAANGFFAAAEVKPAGIRGTLVFARQGDGLAATARNDA